MQTIDATTLAPEPAGPEFYFFGLGHYSVRHDAEAVTLGEALRRLGLTEVRVRGEGTLEREVVAWVSVEHHAVSDDANWWCGTARVRYCFRRAYQHRGRWEASARGSVIAEDEDGVLEVMFPC